MFDSAHSALRWASLMRNTLIVDGSSINDMCGKPKPTTTNDLLRGLSPQEAQQQAASILNHVSNLSDPVCSQYLQAKYFFSQSIEGIVQRLTGQTLHAIGGTNRRDVSIIVLSYLGHRVTKRQMRQKLQCRTSDVVRIEEKVCAAMDQVHYRAVDEIEKKLSEVGMIG